MKIIILIIKVAYSLSKLKSIIFKNLSKDKTSLSIFFFQSKTIINYSIEIKLNFFKLIKNVKACVCLKKIKKKTWFIQVSKLFQKCKKKVYSTF